MPVHYEIKVQGRLDPHWSQWFNGWKVAATEDDQTLLSGPVADQAALHGLLDRVRDLGLVLVAVRRIEDQKPGFYVSEVSGAAEAAKPGFSVPPWQKKE